MTETWSPLAELAEFAELAEPVVWARFLCWATTGMKSSSESPAESKAFDPSDLCACACVLERACACVRVRARACVCVCVHASR